jgi:hypothetical protein
MNGLEFALCGGAYPVAGVVGFGINLMLRELGIKPLEIHDRTVRMAAMGGLLVLTAGSLLLTPEDSWKVTAITGLVSGALFEGYSTEQ